MGRFLFLAVFILLVGCAGTARLPIHKVVDATTIRTKVVLLQKEDVELAYQKTAVREFEAALLKEPVGHVLRTTFGGERVDLVLITRKEVQTIDSFSPEVVTEIGAKSDLHVLIVLEPLKVYHSEGSSRRGEEFCVTRKAEAIVSVKVADARKGDVILAGVYDGKAEARQCSKGIRRTDRLPTPEALVVKALKRAASKFSKEFWSNL